MGTCVYNMQMYNTYMEVNEETKLYLSNQKTPTLPKIILVWKQMHFFGQISWYSTTSPDIICYGNKVFASYQREIITILWAYVSSLFNT